MNENDQGTDNTSIDPDQIPKNLEAPLDKRPRRIQEVNEEKLQRMQSAGLNEIDKEHMLNNNAHARHIYKKDWRGHKYTGNINWKEKGLESWSNIENHIRSHYLQTTMYYIITDKFLDAYKIHDPGVAKILPNLARNFIIADEIIEDATSLYGCLLYVVRKVHKYHLLIKFQNSPFGPKNNPSNIYPDYSDDIMAWMNFVSHFDQMGNKDLYL